MSEGEEEVGTRSPFGGSVASDDRELAIDEGVLESSVVPNLKFVRDSNVVIHEGEECVRRVLEEIEEIEANDGRIEEASEGDSFVDIMGSLDKVVGSESERVHVYWHSATGRYFARNCTGGRGRCSWFAIVLLVILHIPLAFFEE